jgi:excisionase family DNA binding protein
VDRRYCRSTVPVMMVGIMSKNETPPFSSSRFLTIPAVGLELATSKSQIYALLRSGDLKGIQIGGRGQWRIERVKLEEYIAEAYRARW